MRPENLKLQLVWFEGASVAFVLRCEGFSGSFRICFTDKTRKNARYRDLEAGRVYYHGRDYFPHLPEYKGKDQSEIDSLIRFDFGDTCYEVSYVTDAMLFVERKTQWILEELMRIGRKEGREGRGI